MLKGYRTYVLAALGVISAAASYLVGDATAVEAGQVAITSILGMTVRNAIR